MPLPLGGELTGEVGVLPVLLLQPYEEPWSMGASCGWCGQVVKVQVQEEVVDCVAAVLGVGAGVSATLT